MTVEEPSDSDIFAAYVEHLLCLALRSGDVVVMGNLSTHKRVGVREKIEAAAPNIYRSTRPTSTYRKGLGQSQAVAALNQSPQQRRT